MLFFFFCKQKTAYEMRISDWSSDVCSSDLPSAQGEASGTAAAPLQSMPAAPVAKEVAVSVAIEEDLSPDELIAKYPPDSAAALPVGADNLPEWQIGRASCREKVCQYV